MEKLTNPCLDPTSLSASSALTSASGTGLLHTHLHTFAFDLSSTVGRPAQSAIEKGIISEKEVGGCKFNHLLKSHF